MPKTTRESRRCKAKSEKRVNYKNRVSKGKKSKKKRKKKSKSDQDDSDEDDQPVKKRSKKRKLFKKDIVLMSEEEIKDKYRYLFRFF